MWISPSYEARESPVSAPFQTVSPVVWPCLVPVGGEQVEVLLALGEVEARVAHVRALLGGHDVQRLLGEPPAEVHRHPAHVGVARDLDALGRDVVAPRPGPSPGSGRAWHVRPGRAYSSKPPACSAWPSIGGAQAVLADRALGVLADDRQRVRVLRGAGLVDQVDDLDRVLDLDVLAARARTRRRSRRRRWRRRTCPRRGRGGACTTRAPGRGAPRRPSRASVTITPCSASSGSIPRRGSCWRRAGRSGRPARRRRGPRRSRAGSSSAGS